MRPRHESGAITSSTAEFGGGLARLLATIGPNILELLAGSTATSHVHTVVIDEPAGQTDLEHAVVLATTARSSADIIDALDRAGTQGASAVTVRMPTEVDLGIQHAVRRHRIALLGLAEGVSWTDLAALIAAVVSAEPSAPSSDEFTLRRGDLYTVADAIAVAVNAPVTIEDRRSRIIAFSDRQHEADEARVDAILERTVPESVVRAYRASGVYGQIYGSRRPVLVEPLSPDRLPRVAVAICAGTEVLGSIWATIREPLTERQERAFTDAGRLVALHMLRSMAAVDAEHRTKTRNIVALLKGSGGAAAAADHIGLRQPALVWACELAAKRKAPSPHHIELGQRQILDALTLDVASLHPSAGVATIDGTTYVVLPVAGRPTDAEKASIHEAQAFLERRAGQLSGRIGISKVTADPNDLAAARHDADRALRVLRTQHPVGVAGAIAQLETEALFIELRDLATARGYEPSGIVKRLMDYDRKRGSHLVPTLQAWLAHFGDVIPAAVTMGVHPNTFRYRLRRAFEIGGIDTTDSPPAMALILELKLAELGAM